MRAITRDEARSLNDAHHALVTIHLKIGGHDELFGALSAAIAAVEKCARIGMRDLDRSEPPPTPPKKKGAKR